MPVPFARSGPRPPHLAVGALLLAMAGGAACLVGMADSLNFTVDDTFISLRYAENLARGRGLVFNPGERIEGFSNLLWTLLLSALARLGINQTRSDLALVIAAKALGVFFGLAALAVTAWLAARITRLRPWGEHSWLMGISVIAVGASYSFATWSLSGMETSMCAFFLTAGVACTFLGLSATDHEPHRTLLALGGVAFGLAIWTRPEPLAVWLVTLAVTTAVAPAGVRRELAPAWALPALFALGLLLWRHGTYGTWVPNSVTAKWGGGALAALFGARYALLCLFGSVGILGIGLLGIPSLLRRGPAWTFLTAFCGSYLVFLVVSGGDWMPGSRFLVPALPALWILGAASVSETAARLRPAPPARAVAAILVLLCAASFTEERFLIRSQIEYPSGLKQHVWVGSPERIAIAREIGRIVPADSTLAAAECGFVPYFNPDLRVLDVFGLMDPEVARRHGMPTQKMTAAWFLAKNPPYYLMMVKRASQGANGIDVPTHADGDTLLASAAFRERYRKIRSYSGFVLYQRHG